MNIEYEIAKKIFSWCQGLLPNDHPVKMASYDELPPTVKANWQGFSREIIRTVGTQCPFSPDYIKERPHA